MRRRIRIMRNDGLYVSHTLTLGQALMLAGLSVEGRFLCHDCGPHRAWLKNYYPALSLRSPFTHAPLIPLPFDVLGGRCLLSCGRWCRRQPTCDVHWDMRGSS